MLNDIENLLTRFNPLDGSIKGLPESIRRLSDLKGIFADEAAFQNALAQADPPVYAVTAVEYPIQEGQLQFGVGRMMPGKIGHEYYMTKGHFHAWRPAAELYIGLQGEGVMLLENEDGSQVQMLPLQANTTIYVPGFTAHRTMNTGKTPLTYIGVYPAQAGHDYGSIAQQNFRHVVADVDGVPTLIERSRFLREYVDPYS